MNKLSLQQGTFPKELEIANVLPLFKACDPYVLLSKVYEKVMYNRKLNSLEDYNIIFENQFGSKKLHSSYMAFMVLTDKLVKIMEKGEFIKCVILDFSKVFETVDSAKLLSTLSHYGIRGYALQRFENLFIQSETIYNLQWGCHLL